MKNTLFPSQEEIAAARILIIDDELAHIRILEWALKNGKFSNFHSINDSTKAKEEFERAQPDIILLDLNMPGLDGYAVLQQLHQTVAAHEFVPVLMLTGENNADTRSRALAAGAHDFLSKPVDYSELMLRMKNLLQTRFLYQKARALDARVDQLSGKQSGN